MGANEVTGGDPANEPRPLGSVRGKAERANGAPGPVVVLLGSPGVGKGTQGTRLSRARGWAHLSTGDLLRGAVRDGSELGRVASRYMKAGALVPDGVIVGVVRDHLAGLGNGKGVVFDGFPRTVPQAEALDGVLADGGRAVNAAVLLEADDEVVVRRIAGRRSSPSGRVYNVYFDPPRRDGICDDTGEALIYRADDRPETVRHRLDVYRRETAPLIDYYAGKGVLKPVDAGGDIEQVWDVLRETVADT